MENGEVIHMEKGSTVELPKGWFKENAPLEFFDATDGMEGDFILTEARVRRIKDRLETIIKNINQVDKKLTRLNAGFRRKASEALVFFLLDYVVRDLKGTMDLLDKARECFVNAENYTDLKIKKHYIASGSWELWRTKDLLDEIERDFDNTERRLGLAWNNFTEAGVIPSKVRDGFEDVKRLLIDISPKLKAIRDEVRKRKEVSFEQLQK